MTDTTIPDYAGRRRRVRDALEGTGCDALVVTRPAHVRWLTGFTGGDGALLIDASGTPAADGSAGAVDGAEPAVLATDSRYTTQVAAQVPDLRMLEIRTYATSLIADLLGRAGDGTAPRIGFEAGHVTVAEATALRDAAGDVDLVETTGIIEGLRAVKDDVEVAALRHAADIAVAAYRSLIDDGCVRAGVTERQVAADLEYRMRVRGADGPSFDTIVASGPNSAKPHHGAEDRMLCDGDLVTIDFGALADGYCSDMTRTTVVGGEDAADDFAKEIFSLTLRAQLAGVEAARAGVALVDVDKACRGVIAAGGYGEYFVHSTGHGVGIDVHEAPYASTKGRGVLRAGQTLTIEPGIYVPGKGGVRIEDTLVITDGAPENLVDLPKIM